jgi:hypothetical protein
LLPPEILQSPTNQTVIAGQDVALSIVVSGTAPLAYQWYVDTTNLLADATNSVLWLTNIQPAAAGGYLATVSNMLGAVTSSVATLTVLVPPQFLESPTNQTVSPGSDVLHAAVVTGTLPLSLQWYFNGSTPLPNSDSPVLMLTNVQSAQAGSYQLLVTNAGGAVTSSPAWLFIVPGYVLEPPDFRGTWLGATTGFELQLPVDNRPRVVFASTNLTDWSTQFLVAPSGLPQAITDSSATNLPRKFYRVRAN